ncbi:MAG: hypothetical protein WCK84_03415 [Bacteroidota bacterium]
MGIAAILLCLQSCLPERKIANNFIESQHMLNLLVNPPDLVYKYNHKGEIIEGFDSLSSDQQDSALWVNSQFVQQLNDSVLLETYMNQFINEMREFGFNVYLVDAIDSFMTGKPQSYILDIPQIQVDEYFYPLLDEDEYMDSTYYKKFELNAVDFSCWFELRKANTENAKKMVLYSSHTAYDSFNGRFFNDPFSSTVRYKYTIDSLKTNDVYEMATYLGKKHAGYLYDYFMNQYIAKNLPEGMRMMDYYHYNRNKKSFSSAYDDRFEILGSK